MEVVVMGVLKTRVALEDGSQRREKTHSKSGPARGFERCDLAVTELLSVKLSKKDLFKARIQMISLFRIL